MSELGLRPDRGHVKCQPRRRRGHGQVPPARRPGDLRRPRADGPAVHDAPAAGRRPRQLRLARRRPGRLALHRGPDGAGRAAHGRPASTRTPSTSSPTTTTRCTQPGVLPAAYPNLLVNGAAGIAVGMATNMAPHNLVEVIGAARHLIAHPTCSLDDLMKFVPGPDLPGGGQDRRARRHPRRLPDRPRHASAPAPPPASRRSPRAARASSSPSCPTSSAPRRSSSKVKDLVQAKKLQGIADVKDLTDRKHGLRLVIEIKNGFNPDAVLEQLYKLTPMEDSFGINNVALVDGQPRTLGLKELLRRSTSTSASTSCAGAPSTGCAKREERLHLVEGLLIAILDIDEVIQLIRSSDDAAMAKARLMDGLRPVRGPGRLHPRPAAAPPHQVLAHRARDRARRAAAPDRGARGDPRPTRSCCTAPCRPSSPTSPRRTAPRAAPCCSSRPARPASVATPLEVADDPCWVLLSSTGLLARTVDRRPGAERGRPRQARRRRRRRAHDRPRRVRRWSPRAGRMVRMSALELPTLPPLGGSPSLSGGAPLAVYVDLPAGRGAADDRAARRRRARASPSAPRRASSSGSPPTTPAAPTGRSSPCGTATRVVGAAALHDGAEDLVFVTSDAQLLRFPARPVRPQGRSAGGMAGIKLAPGAPVTFFGAVDPAARRRRRHLGRLVRRPARHRGRRAQGDAVRRVPRQGPRHRRRSCHRFLRGEDTLVLAWVGARRPARPARTAWRSSCRRPPASATARARLPGGHRRGRRAGALTAYRRNGRVTQSLPAGGAGALRCVCKRFYLGPGSLIAEADNPSRRDQ